MTENMKAFLEVLSKEDSGKNGKIHEMDEASLIALAAEKGITLTEADFRPAEDEGEVSLDEADAVAGGKMCKCVVGGGGKRTKDNADGSCGCVAIGSGVDTCGNERCMCVGYGHGYQCNGINGSIYH